MEPWSRGVLEGLLEREHREHLETGEVTIIRVRVTRGKGWKFGSI